jgi:small subunit ribosomal protein S11
MSNITNAQNLVPQQDGAFEALLPRSLRPRNEPHHLHIYAHKHNTHIVLTRPNREPILAYSAGNIGFRKAQRGSFDAAFQLAAYVMRTITDKGLLRRAQMQWSEGDGAGLGKRRRIEAPIQHLELVLRGFGKGRDAVVKALLGTEGRALRDTITVVSDDTKLKFGGTRSPKPRRLG